MSLPYLKRAYNTQVVDWTEALTSFDKSVLTNKEIKFNYPGFFVSHEGHEIPKIKVEK